MMKNEALRVIIEIERKCDIYILMLQDHYCDEVMDLIEFVSNEKTILYCLYEEISNSNKKRVPKHTCELIKNIEKKLKNIC